MCLRNSSVSETDALVRPIIEKCVSVFCFAFASFYGGKEFEGRTNGFSMCILHQGCTSRHVHKGTLLAGDVQRHDKESDCTKQKYMSKKDAPFIQETTTGIKQCVCCVEKLSPPTTRQHMYTQNSPGAPKIVQTCPR